MFSFIQLVKIVKWLLLGKGFRCPQTRRLAETSSPSTVNSSISTSALTNLCDWSEKHVVDWGKTIIWRIDNIDFPQERKIYISEELGVCPVEAGGAVVVCLLIFVHLQQRCCSCSSTWCHFNVVQETDFPRFPSISWWCLHMVDKVEAFNSQLATLALALPSLRAVQSRPAWPWMRFHSQNLTSTSR